MNEMDTETKAWARRVVGMFHTMQSSENGYAGVTHAGIALVSVDGLSVLLAQRTMDETDEPEVQETWEFVGGGLEPGEEPFPAAEREFGEEMGLSLPEGMVVNGWRSDDDVYQGFVYRVSDELDLTGFVPTAEVQAAQWFKREDIDALGDTLRPEVAAQTDWDLIFDTVSEKEVEPMTASAPEQAEPDVEPEVEDYDPEFVPGDFDLDGPTPVHGVIAPEEMSSGDRRAFTKGAMTRRPLRLPLRDTHEDVGGHDKAITVGSVDRMMRKDGLIHWEGALMDSAVSEPLVERMQFFDGKYGVSVDGDQGNMDEDRTEETGTVWFDRIRAAGLTAVAIPAFHEAYVAFGPHPEMPADDPEGEESALTASMYRGGHMIGARREAFGRGPGWVTDPKATNRIHDYWTKKGEPGYAKVAWGTGGDFTRAKKLIGAKIAEHSPDKMRFLNQIIAQWHFDALGYWPGELGKPGNAPDTPENRRRAATHAAALTDSTQETDVDMVDRDVLADRLAEGENDAIAPTDDEVAVWETVLVSSAGVTTLPPLTYFHQYESDDKALTVEPPDALGIRRVHGFAAQWGVCHVGMQGRCVEPPRTYSDDYSAFHLGVTHTDEGKVYTGVLTYGVGHRDAETILSESPEQAYFDNVDNAWAAVRVGENEEGIWFSGYVLPGVPEEHLVKIAASGQVSGEWLGKEMRACLTVNVPGFAVERPSVAYDNNGNVMALAASAFGQGAEECEEHAEGTTQDKDLIAALADEVMGRIQAREQMDALRSAEAKERMARVRMSLVREEF